MGELKNSKVIVAGAGVFALACALTAVRRGAQVRLVAPAGDPRRASAVAAGMLAPAMEALLDPLMAGRYSLLAQARDAWPAFATGLEDLTPVQCGAQMVGEGLASARAALMQAGAVAEIANGCLFTPDDWRIDAPQALAAMTSALDGHGVQVFDDAVVHADARRIRTARDETFEADAVVLATGFGGLELAPELASLTPIKGQLLRYAGAGPTGGPILRGQGYVVPGKAGAMAGATMEDGKSDIDPVPAAAEDIRLMAEALVPTLSGATAQSLVGVRPASPDGLPLAGRSTTGVWIANGARRNGWLFAPMVADIIAAGIAGAAVDARFDPGRFSAV